MALCQLSPLRRSLPAPSAPHRQTRRLTKFPEAARAKCESFQLQPPRHAITREQTRQKLPELQLPAEVGGGREWLREGGGLWRCKPGEGRVLGAPACACCRWVRSVRPRPRAAVQTRVPMLASPAPPQIVGPIQVARRSDMDMNGHVNNVRLEWMC